MTRDLAQLGQLSRQVTQTCQVCQLCRTWPKKKMLRPSLPQGIPIPQTWPISGTWPRQPRHLMSHPSDLRAAQFHCNIHCVNEIIGSVLYCMIMSCKYIIYLFLEI